MTTVMISILPDGIPVDKMQGGDDDDPRCPVATQDEEVSHINKVYAHDTANYEEAVSDESCGVCASYNQTPNVLECMGDDSGDIGYCQIYKFVCMSDYVCDSWSEGGPMTGNAQETYKDIM